MCSFVHGSSYARSPRRARSSVAQVLHNRRSDECNHGRAHGVGEAGPRADDEAEFWAFGVQNGKQSGKTLRRRGTWIDSIGARYAICAGRRGVRVARSSPVVLAIFSARNGGLTLAVDIHECTRVHVRGSRRPAPVSSPARWPSRRFRSRASPRVAFPGSDRFESLERITFGDATSEHCVVQT